jgi:hypothetical protein
MQDKPRFLLLGAAFVTALSLVPAETAQAAHSRVAQVTKPQALITSDSGATEVNRPPRPRKRLYDRGYREGYAQGTQDGYNNCRRTRSFARGTGVYTQGWTAGYGAGFRSICAGR